MAALMRGIIGRCCGGPSTSAGGLHHHDQPINQPAVGYPTSAPLTFVLNGQTVEVADPDPDTIVVDWLRQEGHTGTKRSCAEGGCGACTIMIQELSQDGKTWKKGLPINSCLTPLVSIGGCKVTTVEGVGTKEEGYHPIQKKMADCNASQCGMCTPGFVVNMYALLQENPKPTAEEVERRFDGNLCRCTGYRPILDAFHSLATTDIEDLAGAPCATRGERGAGAATLPACAGGCAKGGSCKKAEGGEAAGIDAARARREAGGVTFYRSGDNSTTWAQPSTLAQLCDLMSSSSSPYEIVASNTGIRGVKKYYDNAAWGGDDAGTAAAPSETLLINISRIQELNFVQQNSNGVELGCLTTLRDAIEALADSGGVKGAALSAHIAKVASQQVRAAATIGGNLSLHIKYPAFPSDVATILAGAGASATLVDPETKKESSVAVEDLKSVEGLVLKSVVIPLGSPADKFFTDRVALRHQNAHAIVNAAFGLDLDPAGGTIRGARIFFGGVSAAGVVRAPKTEAILIGKSPSADGLMGQALSALSQEVVPDDGRQKQYKSSLIQSLFYKFLLGLQPHLSPQLASAAAGFDRPVSTGLVDYKGAQDPNEFPVSENMPKVEALTNTSGETLYVDDLPEYRSSLHCAFVLARTGPCSSFQLDFDDAIAAAGFVCHVDASSLSSSGLQNAVSPSGEPLFAPAKSGVAYVGQRLAMVVCDTEVNALEAARAVKVSYGPVTRDPVLTIEDAIAAKSFYNSKAEAFSKGDAPSALSSSAVKFSGVAECGHQHHFYLEQQTAVAARSSDGIKLAVSTQGPGLIAAMVSSTLGVPKTQVEVVQGFAGGAYGGKSSKSVPCALAAAVGTHFCGGRPVKCKMEINDNLAMLGSRRPHRLEYQVGCTEEGKINAIVATLYYQQGAYLDFGDMGGLDVLQMSLDGVYNCENWQLSGFECKTDTPGNTFCRGPVFLPGTFLIESVLDHVAHQVGREAEEVKSLNLYKKGDVSLAGQTLADSNARATFDLCVSNADFGDRAKEVEDFNAKNALVKRGLAICPSKYMMNPCTGFPSLVSVQEDASVLIQHTGCEIGQGLNTKAVQTAALELGVACDAIKCAATSSRIAKTGNVTGGSTTSEAICASTVLACQEIARRMAPVKQANPDAKWADLVSKCYSQGIDLAARAVYDGSQRQPGVLPDQQDNGPSPYVQYGCAAVEVQVDVLTGETQVLRVDLVQDNGISLNTAVDVGQIQGSFIMGLGYMLTEEFVWDRTGKRTGSAGSNVSNGTWEYKPMSSLDIPIEFNVTLLPKSVNSHGVLGSKSVGEPPLILSAGVVSAVRKAVQAFRRQQGGGKEKEFCAISAPATVEKVQLATGLNLQDLPLVAKE